MVRPALPIAAHVDVLLCPEALAGAAFSFIDLLRTANTIAGLQHGDTAPRIGWRLVGASGRPLRRPHALLARYADAGLRSEHHPRRALFVPPLLARNLPALRATVAALGAVTDRIDAAFDDGRLVVTQGASTWLAARTGRLGGLAVALPWYQTGGFRQDFPEVAVAPGRAWVHDGPLLSGAGGDTLGELALAFVGLAAGDALAQACANVHRHAPERQHAALTAADADHLGATRASPVARAVAWLAGRLAEPYRLDAVATAAAVSPRTLLRHFHAVYGHSPLDHLHRLRCERARVLLEITLDGIPAIAETCGYADPAAFRRVFVRHLGESPAAYRRRYALRAPRMRWQVEDGDA